MCHPLCESPHLRRLWSGLLTHVCLEERRHHQLGETGGVEAGGGCGGYNQPTVATILLLEQM